MPMPMHAHALAHTHALLEGSEGSEGSKGSEGSEGSERIFDPWPTVPDAYASLEGEFGLGSEDPAWLVLCGIGGGMGGGDGVAGRCFGLLLGAL